MKLKLQLILAIVLALAGLVLMTASFIVPPTGVIDPTVLTAIGEVFTFSGSLIGIDTHYAYKHKSHSHPHDHGETE